MKIHNLTDNNVMDFGTFELESGDKPKHEVKIFQIKKEKEITSGRHRVNIEGIGELSLEESSMFELNGDEEWGEWEDIEGYPGYIISRNGDVYSFKRKIFLKQKLNDTGYYSVMLSNRGRACRKYLHNLVYNAFGFGQMAKVFGADSSYY